LTYKIKAFSELTNIEVYQMIKIREEIFILEQDCVYVDCDGNDPVCFHMIVKDEDVVIGNLRIVPAGVKYKEVSIGRVVVIEAYRRKGIADLMMKQALGFIKSEYNVKEVVLSAQVVIKQLYERNGFKVISDIYLEDGIDHVKMIYKFN
jgi:ElaA protein